MWKTVLFTADFALNLFENIRNSNQLDASGKYSPLKSNASTQFRYLTFKFILIPHYLHIFFSIQFHFILIQYAKELHMMQKMYEIRIRVRFKCKISMNELFIQYKMHSYIGIRWARARRGHVRSRQSRRERAQCKNVYGGRIMCVWIVIYACIARTRGLGPVRGHFCAKKSEALFSS